MIFRGALNCKAKRDLTHDFFYQRYHPPGTPPGTLVESPTIAAKQLQIRLIDYCVDNITIREDLDVAECHPYLQGDSMTWVHVQGQPTEAALRELGDAFQRNGSIDIARFWLVMRPASF